MKPGSEAIVRSLLERHPGPVFVLDDGLCYVDFNSQHAHAMQTLYAASPAPGLRLPDLIGDSQARRQATVNLERALVGETVVEETPHSDDLDDAVCFRVSHFPIREGQSIVGIMVTALDISEELRTKSRLIKSQQRLTEALEASEIASWSFVLPSGDAEFSARYHTMLGYQPGSFPPRFESWTRLLHPDDSVAVEAAVAGLVQSSLETFRLEFRLRTASGGWKWILGQGKVVERSPQGRPLRVAGTNQDVTQRKLAELALVESESRWTSLVDLAPVGITLVGPQGVVQFSNRQRALFEREDVLGRTLSDLLPKELAAEVDRVLDEGYQKGLPAKFHSWTAGKDGGIRRFENFVGPIVEHHEVSSLMIVSTDVTAAETVSRRREKANRRMEILLDLHSHPEWTKQVLLDRALDAAVELTESQIGYIYFYSEETQLFALHSWSKSVMDACMVTNPQTTYSLGLTGYWGEVVRQRQPILVNDFQMPSPYHKGLPTGHVPLKRFLTVPVFEGNHVVAVVGVGNKAELYDTDDQTELSLLADSVWHLQRQRETEESLRRLHQAIEHAPVSVLITDKTGTISYVNPRVIASTGYSERELVGANPRIMSSGLMDPLVYQDLWRTLLTGNDWQGEIVNRRKDGTLLTELASISPVQDTEGTITHFIAVKEDVTERKATQDLLYQAQKMETVGQLAAGVAHDFNNLLTSVLGYNQMLLLKMKADNPLRVYAEKLELSANRAATLVTGLLAIGRQQRLTPALADLNQLLRDEEGLLLSLVKGVAELVFVLDDLPVPTVVDVGQVGQVVVNLVSNAKDATGPGGRIVVSTGRLVNSKGSLAWIRVEDDGPGIPEELREKVFEPFFTTKGIGKGTGMGLSIVRGAIQQMNGTISLDRRSQPGASFLVTFPLAT